MNEDQQPVASAPDAGAAAPVAAPPATPDQDDAEWEQAGKDFQAGTDPIPVEKPGEEKKPEGEEEKPADAKVEPTAEEKAAADAEAKKKADEAEAEKAKGETPEQTKARHEKEAADAKAAEEAKKPEPEDNPTYRDQRAIQRELAEDEKAMKSDIREKMFSEVPSELLDADGEPIKTVADVMKLENPNTKKAFTAEEAAIWLFQAQKHIENTNKETETKINEIADVHLTLQDNIQNVRVKYGELLKALPKVQKEIWAEYEKTLEKDAKSGIIIKAPVNLERFYEIALRPYAQYAARLEKEANEAKAAEDQKTKSAAQSDRTDIISGGASDVKDADEKEWEAAAKVVYAPLTN